MLEGCPRSPDRLIKSPGTKRLRRADALMQLTGHGYLQIPQEIVDESENSGRLRETQEGSSRSPAV